MDYDVIIIGGGAAGLSAALWCDDLNLKAVLLETGAELGGQLLRVYNPILNHLGIETENGRRLRDVFVRQIEKRRFVLRLHSEIVQADLINKTISLAGGENISAPAIIIATGVRRRKLNIEGEEKFKARGIIESGKRDAYLIKDKNVCIVGGGDAAFENALIVAETARSVMLVHRGENYRARPEFVEQVENNPKVEMFRETVVRKIFGSESIEAIELENRKTKQIYKKNIEAVLIRIGVEPNTAFLEGKLNLDAEGYVKINQNCETNVENVYAVGDVANPIAPTVSSAVGMGATAVKTIANLKLRITN